MPPPLPALVGTAWLDGDADGIRGSAGNRTLNALEYNVGVGGVVATLVGCGDDADAGWSTTTASGGAPSGGGGGGGGARAGGRTCRARGITPSRSGGGRRGEGNLGGGRGERSCYEMRGLPRTAGNNCELRFIPHIHCHYRQRLIQWCPSPPPPPPPLPLHSRNCLDYIAEKGGAWFHSIEQGD